MNRFTQKVSADIIEKRLLGQFDWSPCFAPLRQPFRTDVHLNFKWCTPYSSRQPTDISFANMHLKFISVVIFHIRVVVRCFTCRIRKKGVKKFLIYSFAVRYRSGRAREYPPACNDHIVRWEILMGPEFMKSSAGEAPDVQEKWVGCVPRKIISRSGYNTRFE